MCSPCTSLSDFCMGCCQWLALFSWWLGCVYLMLCAKELLLNCTCTLLKSRHPIGCCVIFLIGWAVLLISVRWSLIVARWDVTAVKCFNYNAVSYFICCVLF